MENESYISVAKASESRLEIKKSVFIGNAKSVSTKDEAEDFIKEIRNRHPDARHICFAYLLRSGGLSRMSDDGEPQGTAGLPMLEIIKKNGVTDIVVTVTRYFGGILLGASGLCRAYGSACADAIKLGGISKFIRFAKVNVKAGYADYPKIENEIKRSGAICEPPVFSDAVSAVFFIEEEKARRICSAIKEITAARASAEITETVYRAESGV